MSLIKSWNQVEAHKSKTGEFPSTPGADHDLYLTWIKQCDARKAHALVLSQTDKSSQNRLNELLKIRALLFRGQLSQADAEIQNLQKLDSDPELQGEALLEQARLAAFQGDWSLAYSLSKTALGSRNLEALSRLSTLQVHALASFELGNLLEAVSALNIAEALTELFPFSISALYAKVLRARIAAREEGVQTGLNRLVQLWDAIRSSSRVPTADEVHTLIFGELDILKFERLNQNRTGSSTPLPIVLSKTCLASFHMTEAMGEQLYSALAALDSAVCADPKLREWFLTRLNQCRAEFKRIDRLIPEVLEQTTASSLSGLLLQSLEKLNSGGSTPLQKPSDVNYIIFLKARWAFRLKPWQAIDLESHPKIIRALQVLAEGPLSKAALFDRVWGNARYASRLHDPLIWYVLSRIKKLIGANFKTKNGIIESTDGVMIL